MSSKNPFSNYNSKRPDPPPGKNGKPHPEERETHKDTLTVPQIPPNRRRSSDTGQQPTRVIALNREQKEKFIGNKVRTSKYSTLTFLPYFLYEQFRRFSNLFFLVMALAQQYPNLSPTGRWTTVIPLVFILFVSAVKEILEDLQRHKADRVTNNQKVLVLRDREFVKIKWREVKVGDFVKVENESFIPADLVLFSTSEAQGICYIETANLDGETNFKLRQALPPTTVLIDKDDLLKVKGSLECQVPNKNLYEFVGSLRMEHERDAIPLGPDQVMLRGAKLRNTKWVLGVAIYTGPDTKLMKNSTRVPLKRSSIEKNTNTLIIFLFVVLLILAIMSAAISDFYFRDFPYTEEPTETDSRANTVIKVFTFIILYNNLIPISLTVTIECVRYMQAGFINKDPDIYRAETDTPALARTSNLNEELGQIRYVFSDKTGTLTQNIMEFKGCSVAGERYEADFMKRKVNLLLKNLNDNHPTADTIKEFLILLSVCHTVIPEIIDKKMVYHAASPDEKALVEGASGLGYVFKSRSPKQVLISAMGVEQKYEILDVIEFTSTRKRMSIIVRTPSGKLRLYCKGADSIIYDRLSRDKNIFAVRDKTKDDLDYFAGVGLRTLCLAYTDLQEDKYKEWKKAYNHASTAIFNREEEQEKEASKIESNLTLIGATAIEDKLQDLVPETIAALLAAGISVWVLTGDKQDTAINIGYSTCLLSLDMELITINEEHFSDTKITIRGHIQRLSGGSGKLPKNMEAAVIIDGKTLTYALREELKKEFINLCCHCRSVIVCRASPLQKAEVVQYVTQMTGQITLAIGDGANDVAMIQKAHVGVGISGEEGLQAVNSSDYAIAQFHFLRKLLFVHGAWNYDRMSKVIFYSFYKNITLYIVQLWYAIYSGWSGQIIFERWTIGFYNMFFACAQPLAMGIFDRHCSQELRMKYPILYRHNKTFTFGNFLLWTLTGVAHSVLLYWVPAKLLQTESEVIGSIWQDGKDTSLLILGNFIYTYVVIVVTLKAAMETEAWTVFHHIAYWGSIILWLVVMVLYSFAWGIVPLAGPDIFQVGIQIMTSPVFWIGCLLVPVFTILPDIIFKTTWRTYFQSLDYSFREFEILNKHPSDILKHQVVVDNPKNPLVAFSSATMKKLFKKANKTKSKLQDKKKTMKNGNGLDHDHDGKVSLGSRKSKLGQGHARQSPPHHQSVKPEVTHANGPGPSQAPPASSVKPETGADPFRIYTGKSKTNVNVGAANHKDHKDTPTPTSTPERLSPPELKLKPPADAGRVSSSTTSSKVSTLSSVVPGTTAGPVTQGPTDVKKSSEEITEALFKKLNKTKTQGQVGPQVGALGTAQGALGASVTPPKGAGPSVTPPKGAGGPSVNTPKKENRNDRSRNRR